MADLWERDLDDHFRKGGDLDTPPGGPYPFEAIDDEGMEVSYDSAQRIRRHAEAPSSVHPYREAPPKIEVIAVTPRKTLFESFLLGVSQVVSWAHYFLLRSNR